MDVVSAGGGKTSESDPDSSSRIQTPNPVSFSNGFLKRGNHGGGGGGGGSGGIGGGVVYKECLKNHAASIGAHAVDGCGEFMPSPTANSADPTSLKCAACGCHRNFHRQESDESSPSSNTTTAALEYQPHHRHHPPPPVPPPLPPPPPHGDGGANSCPSSPSPPPISSSYYPSAPHLLLTLSGGSTPVLTNRSAPPVVVVNGRKRFRSRFTQDQKAKMLEFAEKLEWKMQRKDEEIITAFCNGIGVEKGVFKVWMHNNKNILGKKEHYNASPATINNHPYSNSATPETNNGNNISFVHHNHNHGVQTEINASNNNHFHGDSFNGQVVGPNGSSSSS